MIIAPELLSDTLQVGSICGMYGRIWDNTNIGARLLNRILFVLCPFFIFHIVFFTST